MSDHKPVPKLLLKALPKGVTEANVRSFISNDLNPYLSAYATNDDIIWGNTDPAMLDFDPLSEQSFRDQHALGDGFDDIVYQLYSKRARWNLISLDILEKIERYPSIEEVKENKKKALTINFE